MSDFTNDLLKNLQTGLAMANAASSMAEAAGVPMSPNTPFFRMGEPIRLLATPSSGNTKFPETGTLQLPPNVTTFRVTNNNPFAIRLIGTRDGQDYQPCTPTTGYLFMPGCTEIYGTRYPLDLTVLSVDGPFAATDPSQKAGTGYLELQYGSGN